MTETAASPPESAETDASAPPAAAASARRPWTLQRKLIVTVVGITSLIMVLVGVSISLLLGTVLEGQLTAQVDALKSRSAGMQGPIMAGMSAEQILQEQPQAPGTLLAIETPPMPPTAAVTDAEGEVVALDAAQIDQLADGLGQEGPIVVDIDDLGTYRVAGERFGQTVVVAGVSRAEIVATTGKMLTTIGLLTAGGLILLATATAWTIRAGLAPLRAVADTAERVSKLPLDQGEVSIPERVPARQADPRTEVGRVGEALNTLLDHVGESLTARQRNEERMRTFVADASHELRTPLASIRGYSELSLRALSKDRREETIETAESSLERIQAQSLRMTTLVEDLLLLARLDEGQELVYGTVDLSRLAIEAVGDARPAGPGHNWVLELTDEPVQIAGDTGRLHQVAANLLANARTHTPEGTTVTVTVAREGDSAVLRVHDDGPGIEPALRDELFQRFSRADRSRARQTGGTGLGLSIARAIVDAHGGTISVESVPGDTSFEVRLPARPIVPGALADAEPTMDAPDEESLDPVS
ncbi:sensor histidine kinase [Microbacterium sp. CFBP9034]|uniref:sensor histidine kinase n=1 Tax=Microbacterium sp. CFBP9034 TaxID=3096540 RepID=UPI002A69B693|nr:ATP-binding protein [Microbacterium sp. CFBP9034]MDY0911031.1 ATP-binding protein [Microbacterium sp. CFBP9034]